MRTITSIYLKPLLAAVLFLIIASAANAQKLPDVQENSLRAPVNIKTDGRATEWNDQFQAYNKSTAVFYSVANDDAKLYLTIQATKPNIINKIIKGGVTFTINSVDKKNDKEGAAIIFPVFNEKNVPAVNLDTVLSKTQTESFMNIINKELTYKFKDIRVAGVKEIKENIISIYNEEGIKAATLFDHKINLTYELAIPLKYLGLSISESKQFAYNIKLNGTPVSELDKVSAMDIKSIHIVNGAILVQATDKVQNLISPTDFWGEYTLSK